MNPNHQFEDYLKQLNEPEIRVSNNDDVSDDDGDNDDDDNNNNDDDNDDVTITDNNNNSNKHHNINYDYNKKVVSVISVGSDNGLLLLMAPSHHLKQSSWDEWGSVAFTWGQFHIECLSCYSL